MSDTPTEYFGPHAKRWTDPDTGVTLSLTPRDYYRLVAEQQLQDEREVQERLALEKEKAHQEADNWPHVITSDRLNITEEESVLFKNRGVLIMPTEIVGHFDTIANGAQRVGIKFPGQVESPPASTRPQTPPPIWPGAKKDPDEQAFIPGRYRLVASTDPEDKAMLARGETRYLTGTKISTTHLEISADGIKPLTPEGTRYLHMVKDGTVGIIRPVEQSAPGKPAARHFRRRKIGRNTLRFGLLYIIAVIGVISVVIEVL